MPKPRSQQSEKTPIVVAVISAVGVIAAAYFSFRGNIAPAELSIRTTQTAEARIPTLMPQVLTPTATLSAITTTPTLTPSAETQPTIQILGTFPAAQNQAIQMASSGLLKVAQQLPLIMKDNLDTNDYLWDNSGQSIYASGIQCDRSLKDSKYSIRVMSTNSGAYCTSIVPKTAKDFYLSAEVQMVHNHNAELLFYYRYIDDNNFYYLVINPQMQTLTLGVRKNGVDKPFSTNAISARSIQKERTNKLTILVISKSHSVYINDNLEILLSEEENLTEKGKIIFGVRIYELDEVEELLIDNVEIRGE